jgi:GR25 family glycosyltransferase involved in LPS biosynthesis/glycosyltransferase involved in cell wall biosynthesis
MKTTTNISKKQTVCLNMIVRNEAHIIRETFDSIYKFIDYYVIVDTGSTDGTQKLIKDYFEKKNIPGEVIEHNFHTCSCHGNKYKKYNWFHFGWNRSYALNQCIGKSDYIWIIDADDIIVGDFKFPTPMIYDCYELKFGNIHTVYYRTQILRNDPKLKWQYHGGLHEFVNSAIPKTQSALDGNYYIDSRRLGARSKDPKKYEKDALIFEDLLKEEPNNDRYVFYCANSWFDYGEMEKALKWYEKRYSMENTWVEERYFSLYRVAEIYQRLNKPQEDIIRAFLRCYKFYPARLEPLFQVITIYRQMGKYKEALIYGDRALAIKFPVNDRLFVFKYMYEYKLKDELAICSFFTGRNYDAHNLWKSILEDQTIDLVKDERTRIENNLIQVNRILNPSLKPFLCFYLGYTNDYTVENINVYGSELAALKLSEYLTTYYEVFVFTKAIKETKVINKVTYMHTNELYKIMETREIDILVISRYLQYFLEYPIIAKKTFLWFHDVLGHPVWEGHMLPQNGKYLLEPISDKIDGIVTLTNWHKNNVSNFYSKIDQTKYHIIGNAVETGFFDSLEVSNKTRIKNRFIWTSNPVRGLDKLVTYFHKIHDRLPDAELYVYRGLEEFQNQDIINEMKKYNYIKYMGKLQNKDLIKEFQKADFWFYPTNWPETYCISALEAQLAGCVVITSNLAALQDTVGDRGILLKNNPYTPEYEKEALDAVFMLADNQELKDQYRLKAYNWAIEQNWKNRSHEWVKLFGHEMLINTNNDKPNQIIDEHKYLKVKLMCNWTTSKDLVNTWSKLCKDSKNKIWNNLLFTDDNNADYYCIINYPQEGDFYRPEKTILCRMEELSNANTFFPKNWITPDHYKFFYYFDKRNSIEWHISKTYEQLMTETIVKSKVLSSVTSSEYRLEGHKKRINFLQFLDKTPLKFDLYGKTNDFKLNNYIKSLPYHQKDEGLLPYKYTIACENSYVDNYYTEKIVDAILSECLCFYYGCPNLEKYIDKDAFIRIDINDPIGSMATIARSIETGEWERRINTIKKEKLRILHEMQIMPVIENIIKMSNEHADYQNNKLNEFFEYKEFNNCFHGDHHLVELVSNLAKQFKLFVETGTYYGASVKYIAKKYPDLPCVSCDTDEFMINKASENVKSLSNVKLIKTSSLELFKTLDNSQGPILFWLDAHTNNNTWLREELEYITKNFKNYCVLIDDFKNPYHEREFQFNSIKYPYSLDSIKDIVQNCHIYFPNYTDKTSVYHPLVGWVLITDNKPDKYDTNIMIKYNEFFETNKTRVVNLKRRSDRWDNFINRYKNLGINFERFDAVDGKDLKMTDELKKIFEIDPNYKPKRHNITHGYRAGVLGCAMSHINLWKELAEDNSCDDNTCYLIIEDDVDIQNNFMNEWNKIYSEIKDDKEWDLIFLGFNDDDINRYGDSYVCDGVMKYSGTPRLHGGGTYCYCIRKKGARKMLELVYSLKVQQPIDHFMIDQFDKLCVYKTFPYLVKAYTYGQNNNDTDIQNVSQIIS